MSTCLQVKDKKYFAVLGYMSVIVIWHFLIELARGGGGEYFRAFFVYHNLVPRAFPLKKGKGKSPGDEVVSTAVMACLGRQSKLWGLPT